jgi:hypothetical protein
MKPTHYIIGLQDTGAGQKLFFGKVENRGGTILEGYVEKDSHIQSKKTSFGIPVANVVVDLGPDPKPGKVYGFDVTNRFHTRRTHEFFGPINFMYKPKKEVAKRVLDAFDRAAAILKKAGFYAPSGNSVWEVNSKETPGKWAGLFRLSSKPDLNPHRFSIKPESLPDSEMVYVIMHEFAHFVHSVSLKQPRINAAWIRLFNTSIKLQSIKQDKSLSLLKSLVEGQERPSDFKSNLDEEDRNAFNWIVRTIKADHAVSLSELDTLFEAESLKDIESLWPKRTLHKKDLAPVVSEYATVSYRELFAESFAFYMTKRKLPSGISTLVEKSISMSKASQDKE